MLVKSNIVLIGPSGVGKTTIGKYISKRLSVELIDTDYIITKELGTSIDKIFKEKGERHFRELEEEIIKRIYMKKNVVVATGGGIILNPINMKLLGKNGQIFLLYGSLNSIVKNVERACTNRPLIEKYKSIEDGINQLLIERKDIYYKYSDYVIYIDDKSVKEIGEEIINLI